MISRWWMMDVNVSELKLAAAEELESEFGEGGGAPSGVPHEGSEVV